jgi:hypothetical protein
VAEPVLLRRGFCRSSAGTASGCGGSDCLVHGLVKVMMWRSDEVCLDAQWESHDSESDVLEVEAESSEDCDEASDHTDWDEAEADVASEEQ